MALPASDAFTDYAGHFLTSYSASWSNSQGAMQTSPSASGCVFGYTVPALVYWNADSFGADQYAEIVLTFSNYWGSDCGVACRVTASGNGYIAAIIHAADRLAATLVIGRLDAGTLTTLYTSDAFTIQAGDTLRLQVSGSASVSLRATVTRSTFGDTADHTETDTSASRKTSGAAGMYAGESGDGYAVNSWTADNLEAPASSPNSLGLLGVG